MGCFSFLCSECGEPIISDTNSDGNDIKHHTHLWLLHEGKSIQHMEGKYNSYGAVEDDNGETEDWNLQWDNVSDLISNSNAGDGIAAIHSKCYKGNVPTIQSADDPDQGWLPYEDDEW